MYEFLYAHKLTVIPPALNTEGLVEQESAAHPPWHKQILHKYLFFRIPLFRPQRFLTHSYGWIAPLYSKFFTILIAFMGIVGFWFALEQWDEFKSTFLHFLTFEGVLYYGLTLIMLKAIHELGHAFMSTRFGARVPIIGIAFLVMFPILYTDTTDAHRLKSKRQRVLIDAAGMLAELSIACIALFAWSFLPDSALRSAAFFAATTSWGLSLMVNLNPFMRFDGYYLMSDLCGQRNMQDRGFALGRWFMRETLFGLGEDIPIACTSRERFWLILYAYGTWVYRFFLFIGIAVLVHALFPKALGIFLFSVEILFFIINPIVSEIRIWWSLRMRILKNKRSLLTGLGGASLGRGALGSVAKINTGTCPASPTCANRALRKERR
jgi:putative peptide zinc metalloprotease protein